MREVMRHVEEEGALTILIDEVEGCPFVYFFHLGLIKGRLVDDFIVTVDRKGRHVVAVERADITVVPTVHRPRWRLVSEVPFANHARFIARRLQDFGKHNFLSGEARREGALGAHGELNGVARWEGNDVQPSAWRITPCKQSGPRIGADGRGCVVVVEAKAVCGEGIDSGRGDGLGSVAAEVSVAEIIEEQHYDIGALGLRRLLRRDGLEIILLRF